MIISTSRALLPNYARVSAASGEPVDRVDLQRQLFAEEGEVGKNLAKLVRGGPKAAITFRDRTYLTDGKLVSRDGRTLTARDVETGEEKWSHTEGQGPGGCVQAFAVSPQEPLIALTAGSQGIALLDARDGRRFHQWDPPLKTWYAGENSLRFAADGRVVASLGNGGKETCLLIYDANEVEKPPVQVTLPTATVQTVSSPDGKTLFASAFYQSRLYAVDLVQGKVAWDIGLVGHGEPATGPEGNLYVASEEGLKALDPATGGELWTAPGRGSGAHVAADGTVYRSRGGSLQAFSASGTEKWTAPGELGFPPVVGDSLLYTTARERLILIDRESGKVVAESDPIGSKKATFFQAPDGKVYLAVDDGVVSFEPQDLQLDKLSRKSVAEEGPRSIRIGDGFVAVGGVRLKARKR